MTNDTPEKPGPENETYRGGGAEKGFPERIAVLEEKAKNFATREDLSKLKIWFLVIALAAVVGGEFGILGKLLQAFK